jgi:hypothetical protein
MRSFRVAHEGAQVAAKSPRSGWFRRALFACAMIVAAQFSPSFAGSLHAADIASRCCADLEERVAELEATSAREGSRATNLLIYGQVNRALLVWDDGAARDAYVTDNDASSSRLGLLGESRVNGGLYVGFRMEVEMKDAASNLVSNGPAGDEGTLEEIRLRKAYVYVDSDDLGRVSLGQQSPATDDITIINLGARMSDAALHYNNNFAMKLDFGTMVTTDRAWSHFAHTVDSFRGDFLRYDSPAIHGFVLTAAVGENDVWDVGLRYAGDWDEVQIAGGVGYMDAREHALEDIRGSLSVLHKDSGLFLSAAGGVRDDDFPAIGKGDAAHFYFAQLGLRRQLLPYGDMAIYGEFGRYSDYGVGRLIQATLADPDTFTSWGMITDSDVQRIGFGIEQSVDDAGLLLYAQYHLYQADLLGRAWSTQPDYSYELESQAQALPVADWSTVVLGARVQF